MKRFHVHVAVHDLPQSIAFYSTLFAQEPSVRKDDYAKWMLEDPRVNFAISQRNGPIGVNHLGFQVDEASELEEIHGRLQSANAGVQAQKDVSCCYARSDKYWVTDPAGVAWESFRSLGSVPLYRGTQEPAQAREAERASCCGPHDAHEAHAVCCS